MFRFVVIAPLMLATAVVLADDAAPIASKTAPAVSFESIDRNNDRRISKTEAGTYKNIIDRFAILDQNGDGFVSKEEYEGRPLASR